MKTAIQFGSIMTAAAIAFHSALGQEAMITVESGSVSSPFVFTNGCICQPADTAPTKGGRAVYSITITNSGSFAIQALVNAPNSSANSFYLNIDAEPEDPTMIWDVPLTSGFEQRMVSWRGTGTAETNQFVPKCFDLAAGKHLVIVRGREANTQLLGLSFLRRPDPPRNLHLVTVQ